MHNNDYGPKVFKRHIYKQKNNKTNKNGIITHVTVGTIVKIYIWKHKVIKNILYYQL